MRMSNRVKVFLACLLIVFTASFLAAQGGFNSPTLNAIGNAIVALFPTAASMADNTSNPSLTKIAAYGMCWDGTNWDRCQYASDGIDNTPTSNGAGGPRILFRATSNNSGRTFTTDAYDTKAIAGLDGILIIRPYSNFEDKIDMTPVTFTSTTTGAQLIGAQSSGIRIGITHITCSNSSVSTFTELEILNGSGGNILDIIPCPASAGAIPNYPQPLPTSAATALYGRTTVSTASVKVTVVAHKIKL